MPKKVAPKSATWSTIFLASSVPTSSAAAFLPAEVQCTQLLSHSKVHRQGTINTGPLPFKPSTFRSYLVSKPNILFNISHLCFKFFHSNAKADRGSQHCSTRRRLVVLGIRQAMRANLCSEWAQLPWVLFLLFHLR